MRIIFFNSTEDDVAIIAGVYADVVKSFFQYHDFLILPYPEAHHIYLPDIDYQTKASLSYKSTYHKNEQSITISKKIKSQLENYIYPSVIDFSHIQNSFFEIHDDLLKRLADIFPERLNQTATLTITISPFGPSKAYDFILNNDNKYDLFIWIRSSGSSLEDIQYSIIWAIVAALVLSLTKIPDELSYRWATRQHIVDFIVKNCLFMGEFTKQPGMMKKLTRMDLSNKLLEDSRSFLRRLKSSEVADKITKCNDTYFFNGITISGLTKKETALLDLLFAKKNLYVSIDDVYRAIHADFNKTEWSIAKLLERLRKKLYPYSYNRNLIKTARGVGYKLICSG